MNGYSSHTYSFYNEAGEPHWVKFHFKTDQGIQNLEPESAKKLAGENPHYHREYLWAAIENGEFESPPEKATLLRDGVV